MDSIEITRDIYQVGGAGLTSEEDAAIYLLYFKGQLHWKRNYKILTQKGSQPLKQPVMNQLISKPHKDFRLWLTTERVDYSKDFKATQRFSIVVDDRARGLFPYWYSAAIS